MSKENINCLDCKPSTGKAYNSTNQEIPNYNLTTSNNMTITYTYNQIRERIAELVPDINSHEGWYPVNKDIFIGRDPSLADVLRAIELTSTKKSKPFWFNGDVNILNNIFSFKEYDTIGEVINWDLSKHLFGQSQENLDLIGSLIF